MSDRDPISRELKIKSGSVKRSGASMLSLSYRPMMTFFVFFRRLLKEYQSYTKEVEAQKIKVDKIAADGVEEWPLRNAVRMIDFLPIGRKRSLMPE